MSVLLTSGVMPSSSKKASDYAVGESVFLNVNGFKKEFRVVSQGLPSSMYDSSCNGTWLLMKDVYEKRAFDTNNNDYKNSDIHTYLNGTFFNLFDSNVQSKILQVKIPYVNGTGSSGSVASGSSGLSTKVFLLSGYEVGWTTGTHSYFPVDGACLDYFNGTSTTDTKRIAYLNSSATVWWLRSAQKNGSTVVWTSYSSGGNGSSNVTTSLGVRPALIIPSTTRFDPDTNTIL